MFHFLMSNVIGFTTLQPDPNSQDPHNPINVHLPQQRVAITVADDGDPKMPGAWMYVPVPSANLGPGVLDEGANWPRFVVYDGECVWMKREEWDMLKLSGNWECTIPSSGYPVACLRPLYGPVPPLPTYATNASPDATSNVKSEARTSVPSPKQANPTPSSASGMSGDTVRPSASRVSLTSAMSVDTVHPTRLASAMSVDSIPPTRLASAMSVDTIRPTRLASAMSVDTIRPSRSGAQLTSYMSVDFVAPADRMSVDPEEMYSCDEMYPIAEEDEDDARSETPTPGDRATTPSTPAAGPAPKKKKLERTTSSASLPKVAGQKRPLHHQHREKRASPAPKRHHGVEVSTPNKSRRSRESEKRRHRYETPRQKRQRERAEYHQRRRELADEALLAELRAEAAKHAELRAEAAKQAEHQAKLMELRARLAEMDRLEREARRREDIRIQQAHALASRRKVRHACAPYEGLLEWRRRCTEYADKRKERPRQIDDIPFPVLLLAPYSLKLVSYAEVNLFFHKVLPFVDPDDKDLVSMFKKLRFQLHPDRFSGGDYAVIEGCEDENRDMIVKVMNEVMQWINPHINEFLDAVASGDYFIGTPTGW